MLTRWARLAGAGIAGMFAGSAAALPLLFLVGPSTIFNDAIQSPKLTLVWNELEPLPIMMSNPAAFAVVLAVVGAGHGLAFGIVERGLPADFIRRGLAFGAVIWLMTYVFFELNGPFGLLGEPLPLVGVELAVQVVGALVEGVVISLLAGRAVTAAAAA